MTQKNLTTKVYVIQIENIFFKNTMAFMLKTYVQLRKKYLEFFAYTLMLLTVKSNASILTNKILRASAPL